MYFKFMEERTDFETFYTTRIEPMLNKNRALRNIVRNWGWGGIIALIFTLSNFLSCQSFKDERTGFGWLAAFGIVILAMCIHQYATKRDTYLENFKETVIREILLFVLPGVIYKPSAYVPSKEYRRSGLYRHRYNYFDGEDYIAGVYKDVHFHCSELHTGYETGTNVDRIIFQGLFFVASVNHFFQSTTYIWSAENEQTGSIADEEYRFFPMPEVFHLHTGSKLFEKYFTVYSTNPTESHYLLTADMMQLLLRFRRQIKREISLSVVAGKCYVAIPIDENLFDPSFSNAGDKETVKGYFFSALLVLSIINQLQLSKLT
ncbi:MAG: DUF3137 domain-containing protein [Ferruginibacter sp.]